MNNINANKDTANNQRLQYNQFKLATKPLFSNCK